MKNRLENNGNGWEKAEEIVKQYALIDINGINASKAIHKNDYSI